MLIDHKKINQELKNLTPGKEARAFHKKYKKHGYSLSLSERYPNLPKIVSFSSLAVALVSIMISIIAITR